ncbi:MAG: adenylylsulfate kinase [Clostridia bacterium]|nr:adenylylsulfate kinase [Clostridia bacterium]
MDNLSAIKTGDMPGDQVSIGPGHVAKANVIFPVLLDRLRNLQNDAGQERVVVAIHGGSGVGKSEIGSLLTHYFNELGIGAYLMSGDNYPHRIPRLNDAERLRIFREYGIKGLTTTGLYTPELNKAIQALQAQDQDADPARLATLPGLETYQTAARAALASYLGTPHEIDFAEVNQIIAQFKAGLTPLFLKRMGRQEQELWYDAVDFTAIQVLLIEWTHGNNDHLAGVDIPILLNSTPQETLAHRRSRNRDGAVDSPFTTMVLEIEQKLLHSQASKASLIVSKSGHIVSYEAYLKAMQET